MYYTVYKITNKINNKIYIGAHKTVDLDDGYMGSGKYITRAHNKYGIENFEKEILHVFDTSDEMFSKEAEIVTEAFIKDTDNYNIKPGGFGGFEHINNNKDAEYYAIRKRGGNSLAAKLAAEKGRETQKYLRENDSQWVKNRSKRTSVALKEYHKTHDNAFKGKTHSAETKRKIGKVTSIAQTGEGNSQYGSMWIYSLEEKQNKKVPKDTLIPEGWIKGRKMKF